MGRYGRPEELAALVGFLASDAAGYITAQHILVDGGMVTAPRYAIYGLKGEWEVEGHGIPPDVEVEELPKDIAAGHDVQLEKAVSVVMEQLKEHPVTMPPIPAYPNYHKSDGLGR